MMIWGNKNHDYGETAMGYGASLYNAVAENSGWQEPNLVNYMESHDEERLIYKSVNFGGSNGDYNTKDLSTALNRIKLNSVFFIPLPGPKMIWQFGELGFDYSFNNCPDGSINEDCRTSEKPLVWYYANDTERHDLYQFMANLNKLKQEHPEFSPSETSYSLANQTKWYKFSEGGEHVIGMGNFDLSEQDIALSFPETGKYYEYFTGDSIEISVTNQVMSFEAGEYRLYSSKKYNNPDIPTSISDISTTNDQIRLYPNPANSVINLEASEELKRIELYSISGEMLLAKELATNNAAINIAHLNMGIYLAKVFLKNQTYSKKLIIQ
jgi:hypothetical protein